MVCIFGDQLNEDTGAFGGFDQSRDAVWMAEVPHESSKVWAHKMRIVFFISAMRHFRDMLRARGITVIYHTFDEAFSNNTDVETSFSETFNDALSHSIRKYQPRKIVFVRPGEWSVWNEIKKTALQWNVTLEERPDNHFMCSHEDFFAYAKDKKKLVMEFFYRQMRKKYHVLMEKFSPLGGQWNYDRENRRSFGREGPPDLEAPRSFPPDVLTRAVIRMVNKQFSDHPGKLDCFDWPVTRKQALQALENFIDHRLIHFGPFQDALWSGRPWLVHSRLSAALNVKLIHPQEVIAAVEKAYYTRNLPLNSVEGYIRQILGWREYIRGIYWLHMPEYASLNALHAGCSLPQFYWNGNTQMNCLRECIHQTLNYGYAHHIQRLMVTGLFAMLYGANPIDVHKWYLAIYIDAVEWVEMPNTLGMSQYADGGIVGTKPYAATGRYIQRMSNYCKSCRYNPAQKEVSKACPFTVLYWNFLERNYTFLKSNRRMALQLRNLDKLSFVEKKAIRQSCDEIRRNIEE